jgi:hypothetical protein
MRSSSNRPALTNVAMALKSPRAGFEPGPCSFVKLLDALTGKLRRRCHWRWPPQFNLSHRVWSSRRRSAVWERSDPVEATPRVVTGPPVLLLMKDRVILTGAFSERESSRRAFVPRAKRRTYVATIIRSVTLGNSDPGSSSATPERETGSRRAGSRRPSKATIRNCQSHSCCARSSGRCVRLPPRAEI